MPIPTLSLSKNDTMKHSIIQIKNESGEPVTAQAPIIISASRATDIPAFYADWFFYRLEKGYVKWHNPFNGMDHYISFHNTRFVVFWTKNPKPLLPYLNKLKSQGIGFYIQYTLNNYEQEYLEPNLPSLKHRIDTFKRFIDIYGKDCLVWRFDPLILTQNIGIDRLLEKVSQIGDILYDFTDKLVFSFADIMTYKKVEVNLNRHGVKYKEWTQTEMTEFAAKLSELNKRRWNYELATCSESINLDKYDIKHNRCIDPLLISQRAPNDIILQNYLTTVKQDNGQRKSCGCIISKDIGQYGTCPHLCCYCYANSHPDKVLLNYSKYKSNPFLESII